MYEQNDRIRLSVLSELLFISGNFDLIIYICRSQITKRYFKSCKYHHDMFVSARHSLAIYMQHDYLPILPTSTTASTNLSIRNIATNVASIFTRTCRLLARRDECPESYCRTPGVGVGVHVRVHKNFNLAYNSWTTIGRAFIFHMCIPCDKTFSWVPKFLT